MCTCECVWGTATCAQDAETLDVEMVGDAEYVFGPISQAPVYERGESVAGAVDGDEPGVEAAAEFIPAAACDAGAGEAVEEEYGWV